MLSFGINLYGVVCDLLNKITHVITWSVSDLFKSFFTIYFNIYRYIFYILLMNLIFCLLLFFLLNSNTMKMNCCVYCIEDSRNAKKRKQQHWHIGHKIDTSRICEFTLINIERCNDNHYDIIKGIMDKNFIRPKY